MNTVTAARLASLSQWIDEANAHRDAEARTWGRLAKVGEEFGELIAAYILFTGQNPRKAQIIDLDPVIKETLDVAVTALCAVEHLTNNRGESLTLLFEHINGLHKRANIREDFK